VISTAGFPVYLGEPLSPRGGKRKILVSIRRREGEGVYWTTQTASLDRYQNRGRERENPFPKPQNLEAAKQLLGDLARKERPEVKVTGKFQHTKEGGEVTLRGVVTRPGALAGFCERERRKGGGRPREEGNHRLVCCPI